MTYENPVGVPPGQPTTSGLAIASLIVGVVSLPLAVFLFPIGFVSGVVGVILGFIARGKIRRRESIGNGIAMGGIVTSIIAIVVAVFVGAVLARLLEDVADCADPAFSAEQVQECLRDRLPE